LSLEWPLYDGRIIFEYILTCRHDHNPHIAEKTNKNDNPSTREI